MKKFVKIMMVLMVMTAASLLILTACSSANKGDMYAPGDFASSGYPPIDAETGMPDMSEDGYNYDKIVEQGFVSTAVNPSSYFSLDRNTACYSLVRRQINDGRQVASDSVRIEELINYFDYNVPAPTADPIAVTGIVTDCPWNSANKLITLGIKTQEKNLDGQNGNYVVLIDVSGSMSGDTRLGYAKKGVCALVDGLGKGDVVSIGTYCGSASVLMEGVECTDQGKEKLKNAVNGLKANGSTNGRGGLELAYSTAQKYFITGGNNRVVLISDGDFNVGTSSASEMKEFIAEKAKTGVYLSVFGVGMGNMRDDMMEGLASAGNGNYAYLDSETEIEKAFVHDIKGNMITVAKDAKAGITFTDSVVKYRLIGYDTKLMTEEDFNDSNKDAGEIGSNLLVTVMYEAEIKEGAEDIARAEIKFKDVSADEEEKSVFLDVKTGMGEEYRDDAAFAACVAEFGLILRNSEYKAEASLVNVMERLETLAEYISGDKYKTEFMALVEKAIRSEFYQ